MNAAEDLCGKAGCRFMDLQVINLRQELPSFYRNRGYAETGTAPLTPACARNALSFRKDVEAVDPNVAAQSLPGMFDS